MRKKKKSVPLSGHGSRFSVLEPHCVRAANLIHLWKLQWKRSVPLHSEESSAADTDRSPAFSECSAFNAYTSFGLLKGLRVIGEAGSL